MELNFKEGDPKPSFKNVSYDLRVFAPLDSRKYRNNDGTLNNDGCNAITETLIQGLVANVHTMHQKKYRDSAEHLRDIIKKLEDGFVRQANVVSGEPLI